MSEWVIAVTIVAGGTSAPELATSLSGVIKGRYAISAGNVIGSDIFNLLGVLGLAGMLRPVEIDGMARISLVALCGMVFLALFFMRTGWRVSRLEGLALVVVAMLRWGFDFSAHTPAVDGSGSRSQACVESIAMRGPEGDAFEGGRGQSR